MSGQQADGSQQTEVVRISAAVLLRQKIKAASADQPCWCLGVCQSMADRLTEFTAASLPRTAVCLEHQTLSTCELQRLSQSCEWQLIAFPLVPISQVQHSKVQARRALHEQGHHLPDHQCNSGWRRCHCTGASTGIETIWARGWAHQLCSSLCDGPAHSAASAHQVRACRHIHGRRGSHRHEHLRWPRVQTDVSYAVPDAQIIGSPGLAVGFAADLLNLAGSASFGRRTPGPSTESASSAQYACGTSNSVVIRHTSRQHTVQEQGLIAPGRAVCACRHSQIVNGVSCKQNGLAWRQTPCHRRPAIASEHDLPHHASICHMHQVYNAPGRPMGSSTANTLIPLDPYPACFACKTEIFMPRWDGCR